MTDKDENGQSRKSDDDEGETGDSPVVEPLCGVWGMIAVRGYEGAVCVMPGLDPGIQLRCADRITGSSPVMTSPHGQAAK